MSSCSLERQAPVRLDNRLQILNRELTLGSIKVPTCGPRVRTSWQCFPNLGWAIMTAIVKVSIFTMDVVLIWREGSQQIVGFLSVQLGFSRRNTVPLHHFILRSKDQHHGIAPREDSRRACHVMKGSTSRPHSPFYSRIKSKRSKLTYVNVTCSWTCGL